LLDNEANTKMLLHHRLVTTVWSQSVPVVPGEWYLGKWSEPIMKNLTRYVIWMRQ
jgi:hypothetical protein